MCCFNHSVCNQTKKMYYTHTHTLQDQTYWLLSPTSFYWLQEVKGGWGCQAKIVVAETLHLSVEGMGDDDYLTWLVRKMHPFLKIGWLCLERISGSQSNWDLAICWDCSLMGQPGLSGLNGFFPRVMASPVPGLRSQVFSCQRYCKLLFCAPIITLFWVCDLAPWSPQEIDYAAALTKLI